MKNFKEDAFEPTDKDFQELYDALSDFGSGEIYNLTPEDLRTSFIFLNSDKTIALEVHPDGLGVVDIYRKDGKIIEVIPRVYKNYAKFLMDVKRSIDV